eukprot:TRINITY_DN15824_c0_g1_i1.p1 TRINITY_DN15824_c0_g1~~TRINITY_DN15824_c0_g1_i1.p1  ORF type:complete len:244 (+),score=28.80 TRINITY_DN15824_c0_g1_i1:38-733(+)
MRLDTTNLNDIMSAFLFKVVIPYSKIPTSTEGDIKALKDFKEFLFNIIKHLQYIKEKISSLGSINYLKKHDKKWRGFTTQAGMLDNHLTKFHFLRGEKDVVFIEKTLQLIWKEQLVDKMLTDHLLGLMTIDPQNIEDSVQRIVMRIISSYRTIAKEMKYDKKPKIEAAVIRILKAKMVLSFRDLVHEVKQNLVIFFFLKTAEIKQAIEDLIERGYLHRDPEQLVHLVYDES